LIDEKYSLTQEKLKVLITEKEVFKEKYDLQLLENERLKEKVWPNSVPPLPSLCHCHYSVQNDLLEAKLQKQSKSMDTERMSQQSYQKSLQETEEQLLRLTRSLDESKADCLLMRKQIAEVTSLFPSSPPSLCRMNDAMP
jgi:hypothetical protein